MGKKKEEISQYTITNYGRSGGVETFTDEEGCKVLQVRLPKMPKGIHKWLEIKLSFSSQSNK